jgi:hypothetical protein
MLKTFGRIALFILGPAFIQYGLVNIREADRLRQKLLMVDFDAPNDDTVDCKMLSAFHATVGLMLIAVGIVVLWLWIRFGSGALF